MWIGNNVYHNILLQCVTNIYLKHIVKTHAYEHEALTLNSCLTTDPL